MISDRGTFSVGHLLRLKDAGYHAIIAAPWDEFRPLFDEQRVRLPWKKASYLSIEQQRRRRQGNLPQEHYELAVLRHELTETPSGRTLPCRVLFVFSTADQKVARRNREKSVAKLRTTSGRRPEYRFQFTYDQAAADRDAAYDGYSAMVTTAPREQSADLVFTKYKQQGYAELANHEFKTPLAVHPVFLKSPRRVEALVFLMMIALTAYFLLQRMYRKSLPAEASPQERRTTAQTLLRAFSNYVLIIHRSRLGREVQPTRLTTRQREILQRLGFDTPAQILSRQLPRAP